MQKRADVVKQCLQYRGTPHPTKGDQPNAAVRAEADIALKAIFSNSNAPAAGAARKMEGYGSEQQFGGGGGGFQPPQYSAPPMGYEKEIARRLMIDIELELVRELKMILK